MFGFVMMEYCLPCCCDTFRKVSDSADVRSDV